MKKTSEKSAETLDYTALGENVANRFITAIDEAREISEKLKELSAVAEKEKSTKKIEVPKEKQLTLTLDDKIKTLWKHIENEELTEDITADFSIDDVIAIIKHDIALRKQPMQTNIIGFVTPIDGRKTISQNLNLTKKSDPTANIAYQIEYLIRSKTGRYAENLLQLWMSATQNIH